MSLDVAAAKLHGVQFVSAHPAGENLQPSADWVELPFSILANHWYGKRPVLFPHRKGHPVGVRRVLFNLKLFVSRTCKLRSRILVLRRIAGFENVFAIRPEQLEQGRGVVMLGRIDGCLNSFLRGRKGPLALVRSARAAVTPPPGRRPRIASAYADGNATIEFILAMVSSSLLSASAAATAATAATAAPAESPPPPLREGPRLEYPWSLCIRAAPPSRTPPKALRFPLAALGATCRLPIRSAPDWELAPRDCACRAPGIANSGARRLRNGWTRRHSNKARPRDARHRGTRRCFHSGWRRGLR